MPDRIARLPKDARGYPIPWNVLRRENGEPLFTVNDDRKHWRAVRQGLCPLCGERLGRWLWFTGGPRSAFDENGWYIDLPAHHECARFALQTCPYLSAKKYVGRIDVPDTTGVPGPLLIDETLIPERPEVFVAVASNGALLRRRSDRLPMLPYVRPERPYMGYEFWRHGRELTLEEAMPILRAALGDDWTLPPLRG